MDMARMHAFLQVESWPEAKELVSAEIEIALWVIASECQYFTVDNVFNTVVFHLINGTKPSSVEQS